MVTKATVNKLRTSEQRSFRNQLNLYIYKACSLERRNSKRDKEKESKEGRTEEWKSERTEKSSKEEQKKGRKVE